MNIDAQQVISLISQFIWILPATLLVIIVIQLLYLIWMRLTFAPQNRTPPPRERSRNLPPQMETNTRPPVVTSPQAANVASAPVSSTPNYRSTVPAPSASEGLVQKKLLVLSGLADMDEVTLPDGDFAIGRYFNLDSNVIVCFDEKSISRKHATFLMDDKHKEYHIVDGNSSYGTFVLIDNRFEPLTPGLSERIYNEDVLQFGNTVKARVILPGETRASTTRV